MNAGSSDCSRVIGLFIHVRVQRISEGKRYWIAAAVLDSINLTGRARPGPARPAADQGGPGRQPRAPDATDGRATGEVPVKCDISGNIK